MYSATTTAAATTPTLFPLPSAAFIAHGRRRSDSDLLREAFAWVDYRDDGDSNGDVARRTSSAPSLSLFAGATLDMLTPEEAQLAFDHMAFGVASAAECAPDVFRPSTVVPSFEDDGTDAAAAAAAAAIDAQLFADLLTAVTSPPPPASTATTADATAIDAYTCEWDVCRAAFASHAALCTHLQQAHLAATAVPFHCLWRSCERHPVMSGHAYRAFPKRNKLVMHVRCHSGEKPFVCGTCRRAFARADGLVSHRKRHERDAARATQPPRQRHPLRRRTVAVDSDALLAATLLVAADAYATPPVSQYP